MPHTVRRRIRPVPRPSSVLIALLSIGASVVPVRATTDCFADRVAAFRPGFTSSPPLFNSWQPGILMGPPGNATPTTGSLSVLSLGRGGEIVLEFTDNEIVDGPGPDFILFENAFFCSTVPQGASDPWNVFAEPGVVAASADGLEFRTFPYDGEALAQATSQCSDGGLLRRLAGLMGITPSFSGNYTVPDDPLVFDAASPGGVSGHGGDAFDLAAVGLASARFLKITDPDIGLSLPGSSEGLDLDGAVALHSRPLPPPSLGDADADGLPDAAEILFYGTDPDDPDSDGDGAPDGAEAASCRNPAAGAIDPFFVRSIDLEVADPHPTLLRWNDLGGGTLYDVVRGGTAALRTAGGLVDLGVVTCIENDSTDLTTRNLLDGTAPLPGAAFFYAVRQNPAGSGLGYGHSSAGEPRQPASGDCR
ncbi:MAG: hypothetical protein ACRD5D_01540 [Candidatus Polarisedimenticolia bacterium]